MLHSSPQSITRLSILKADKFYSAALLRVAQQIFPSAIVQSFDCINRLAEAVQRDRHDLLVTGACPADGEVLDFFCRCLINEKYRPKIVVVTNRRDPRFLAGLYQLKIPGLFDTKTENPETLGAALATVANGHHHWSPSLIDRLQKHVLAIGSIFQRLTPTEQVVFSIIGDGTTDDLAADRLGMRPSTVSVFRREIHRKLRVHEKGELVRLAFESGYVSVDADGIVRPGLSMLQAAKKGKRRGAPSFKSVGPLFHS